MPHTHTHTHHTISSHASPPDPLARTQRPESDAVDHVLHVQPDRRRGDVRALLMLLNPSTEALPALQRPLPLYYSGVVGATCVSAHADPSDSSDANATWTRECTLDVLGRCALERVLVPPAAVVYYVFRDVSHCARITSGTLTRQGVTEGRGPPFSPFRILP